MKLPLSFPHEELQERMKEWEVVGMEPVISRFFYGQMEWGHALGLRIPGTRNGYVLYIRSVEGLVWARVRFPEGKNAHTAVSAVKDEWVKNADRRKFRGLT